MRLTLCHAGGPAQQWAALAQLTVKALGNLTAAAASLADDELCCG